MRRALVLGAEYEMGNLISKALSQYNWYVVAAIDDPQHTVALHSDMTLAELGEKDVELLEQLIQDVDTVFLHLPDPSLGGQVIFSLDTVLALIIKHGRHLMLTTNHYEHQYSRLSKLLFWKATSPITTALPHKLTRQLNAAADAGASISVMCCGHSLSCARPQSYLGMFIKENDNSLTLQSPGPFGQRHYWTYLPDFAENIVHQLSTQKTHHTQLEVSYYPGHLVSIQDIARSLALSCGKPVNVTQLSWGLIEAISLFSPVFRGLAHMRSVWQCGQTIPSSNLLPQQYLFVHTPLEIAVQQSWRQDQ
ncbi:hypothetical protein ABT56_00675 [Photobacterium aquae]|uniref:NAD-dependent epimerase/dehydratase domain-containing protein n=2 Tax=Photobacterium aquae TaxID=1195763 RepID=A0A0J1HD90_9GAMM|nr:hypothetical protein ABT56_00675 [Photobacterium aquae]